MNTINSEITNLIKPVNLRWMWYVLCRCWYIALKKVHLKASIYFFGSKYLQQQQTEIPNKYHNTICQRIIIKK